MLRLIKEDIRGVVVWCVAEIITGLPDGSWAKFTSKRVAQNFMRWLIVVDTESLIRRKIAGTWTHNDRALYDLINTRKKHETHVDVTPITGTYWQRYPELLEQIPF